MSKEVK